MVSGRRPWWNCSCSGRRQRTRSSSWTTFERRWGGPAGLCSLDGIPLAIELAAVADRVVHPSGDGRVGRTAVPVSWPVGGGARWSATRPCARAVDWSYELLTDRERVVLARLAVFSGGFNRVLRGRRSWPATNSRVPRW